MEIDDDLISLWEESVFGIIVKSRLSYINAMFKPGLMLCHKSSRLILPGSSVPTVLCDFPARCST